MNVEIIGLLNSLADIMDEESTLLSQGNWPPDVEALAAAKLRLTGTLEGIVAEQERTIGDWLAATPAEGPLAEALARVRTAAGHNSALLSRQIALSQELLHEIAREAGRIDGKRQQTYQRGGQLSRRDGPAPVTLNTRL